MPNVIIEVSDDNLINQPNQLLAKINESLWQSGQFQHQADIKSRIYYPDNTLLGLTHDSGEAFIVVHFYLMPGRDNDTIKALAQRIADAIKMHLQEFGSLVANGKLQICVNPTELSNNYVKQIV